MFPIINTCLKTYLEYVTQYLQANACIRSKRALCKLEGRMHDRGCNFFFIRGAWVREHSLLDAGLDLTGPVATLFLAASFIRTQQLGRCTLSRTPHCTFVPAGTIYALLKPVCFMGWNGFVWYSTLFFFLQWCHITVTNRCVFWWFSQAWSKVQAICCV